MQCEKTIYCICLQQFLTNLRFLNHFCLTVYNTMATTELYYWTIELYKDYFFWNGSSNNLKPLMFIMAFILPYILANFCISYLNRLLYIFNKTLKINSANFFNCFSAAQLNKYFIQFMFLQFYNKLKQKSNKNISWEKKLFTIWFQSLMQNIQNAALRNFSETFMHFMVLLANNLIQTARIRPALLERRSRKITK